MERGVRPIGDWSILITLSRYSKPVIFRNAPGRTRVRLSFADKFLQIISLTSEDFPEPDTPVTQVKVPNGIEAVTFFKLFSDAPTTVKKFPFPERRFSGSAIFRFPLKYCPVSERSQFKRPATSPE